MSKAQLIKSNFKAVEMFTADIANGIRELEPFLKDAFQNLRRGEAGDQVKSDVVRLFNEWLNRSLLPTIDKATKFTFDTFTKLNKLDNIQRVIKKGLRGLGNLEDLVVEIASEKAKGTPLEDAVVKNIWLAYARQMDAFAVQTAHLIVGRIVMYLVGVNKKAWNEIAVQDIARPFLSLYWNVRSSMSALLPSLYFLNEFDWLYMDDLRRQSLSTEQKRIIHFHEEKLDKALGRLFSELSDRYDYSHVDVDVWKSVYQGFLSPEEVNKLGFVTTPDEIVDLVLDLAGYTQENEKLCNAKILDPACGSGTFLVEAMVRLRRHLETPMKCHYFDFRKPTWETEKDILERIVSCIHGIDIHPFAAFLTSMNLTFQLIDMYSRVKHKYEDFTLSLKVVTHDSLAEKPSIIKMPAETNSRLKEAVERSGKYAELCNERFEFVVGNPPWGAVLKGGAGPLGDRNIKQDYKARFKSAYDKYDIFVLFIERGIQWLEKRGVLGLITQNTWLSMKFGIGIKGIIKNNGRIKYFVDLGTLGHLIFPRWTNYPSLTIFEKGLGEENPMLVEVEKK